VLSNAQVELQKAKHGKIFTKSIDKGSRRTELGVIDLELQTSCIERLRSGRVSSGNLDKVMDLKCWREESKHILDSIVGDGWY
jgi:hypothetical protein